ncbi:hypothetical protein SAMN05660420_02550 [Desulfuromusa kysingii]|uniref:Uncharacterized protein n=1 Tax=Desulfuromusa kysingii TaxID=37625 RepID=A0A1H4CHH4_9BACT|nr:hypothetical protein [Desulfuromusa kysingii]SEA59807.1 hypothetical protein SAMN05660420_02550 [Desulfuromusa kysingii]
MLKLVDFLCVCVLLLLFFVSPALSEVADNLQVKYFAETDLLSIEADNHSLDLILGQIALQTGMDISMSPLAERNVSLSVPAMPLKNALKKLTKDSHASYMLIYGHSADMKLVPIGMKIFPQGSFAQNDLKPVVPVELEAMTQTKMALSLQPEQDLSREDSDDIRNLVQQRWQERLEQMPEEKREMIELRVLQQAERQREKRQKRAEKEEQLAQQKALLDRKRKAKEEQLRAHNPIQYEQKKQQQKAKLERDKELFYQYNPPK